MQTFTTGVKVVAKSAALETYAQQKFGVAVLQRASVVHTATTFGLAAVNCACKSLLLSISFGIIWPLVTVRRADATPITK